MAQSLQSAIVENQRLQAQIKLMRNVMVEMRNDLLDRAEMMGDEEVQNVAPPIWNEFLACIDSTPEQSTQAIGMSAIQDYAAWLKDGIPGSVDSYFQMITQNNSPVPEETVQ